MDLLRPGRGLRPQLLADGLTDHELRTVRRRGVLTRLRPGAYLQARRRPPRTRTTCWPSVRRCRGWVRTR